MKKFKEITVNTKEGKYPVCLYEDFSGLSKELGSLKDVSNYIIMTDRNVAGLFLKYISKELKKTERPVFEVFLKSGEKNKHVDQLKDIYNQLIELGADRRTVIVSIGGGVVGDFSGFVAATYLRGIRYVQVPTTLLSCVDSSVGGKVAVNASLGKNMIGAFYNPELVFMPMVALSTLPTREWRCGLAEVVKHSLLVGGNFYKLVKEHTYSDIHPESETLRQFITESIEFKAKIVAKDAKEMGLRQVLNLGHTTGHALESLTHYKKYNHGEAVAIGLVTACILSTEKLGMDPSILREIIGTLKNYRLPYSFSEKPKKIIEHMAHDKKNESGTPRFVLLKKPGSYQYGVDISGKEILAALKEQKKL